MTWILLIAVIVISVVLFDANSRINRLESDLKALRHQALNRSVNRPELEKQERKNSKAPPLKSTALNAPAKTVVQEVQTLNPPVKPKNLKPKKRSFEEEIGARWAVWVGGLTLGLGAIFLLRFAAEAGVFTPAMRVALAVLMGLISLGASEFLRRKDNVFFKDKLKIENAEHSAYIPGVLTGVGIFALFGAIYAAYALYDLIPAIAAFIGMAIVSFAALGLSVLQGPKIAGLGLVGSLVTPLLVSSDLSNYPMLLSYVAVVTLASIVLSRTKKWGWLAIAALFGALFWMWMVSFNAAFGKAFWPWCIYTAALFGGSIWVSRSHEPDATKPLGLLDIDFDLNSFTRLTALVWFALWALIFMQFVQLFNFGRGYIVVASLAAGALMGAGYLCKRLPQLILIGGLLSLILVFSFANQYQISVTLWVIITVILAALFMGIAALKSKEDLAITPSNIWPSAIWALLGTIVPILMLLTSDAIRSLPAANTAILLFGAFAVNIVLAAIMPRSKDTATALDAFMGPAAFYCAGAAIAYTLTVGYGFDGWPFSLAMILGLPLSLAAYGVLKESILKLIAVGFAALTALHVLFVQLPLGSSVGPQIIFNALWFYLALPAAFCAAGAWHMSRADKEAGPSRIWTELLKAFSLSFIALFAVFQVRHLMNGGDLLSHKFTFDEMAMQVLVGLCFTVGGLYLGKNDAGNQPSLLSVLAMGMSGVTVVLFVLGICFFYNPLLNAGSLINGGAVFNSLMLAYLLPAVALGAIAWIGSQSRSQHYLRICGGLSLVSFMIYVTTMIRRGFSGHMISIIRDWPRGVELYVISAFWLMLGVSLLALGMKLGRRDIRLASAFVIVLTVLKAFLVDMASLEGALRAMSFVVLGVVLIVIGRVYQRILFSSREAEMTVT